MQTQNGQTIIQLLDKQKVRAGKLEKDELMN